VVWPLADNQGTIRDLVDETGSVLNHIKYDSFGKVTSETNGAVDFLFAYTGRERDEETGLYYYRARFFDPLTGRFISEDPLGFAAGDANVNRYVGNHPNLSTDPMGLQEGCRVWQDAFIKNRLKENPNGPWFGPPGQPPGGGGSGGSWPSLPNPRETISFGFEIGKGTLLGVIQGGANIANGVQDIGIGFVNLVPGVMNGINWLGGDDTRLPFVPSLDWSRDLIIFETGEPGTWTDTHGWSKGIGGVGATVLLPKIVPRRPPPTCPALPAPRKGPFGAGSIGAAKRIPRVVQSGGQTIRKATADALNEYTGRSLTPRDWGRALEKLKDQYQLPNKHHGKILDNCDYADEAGNVIDNIEDYL
ncbi:RHS repeat-associated core domain-containing protein, partial [Candidatus Kaiserbacteria bacterium]|nr:RHS repeat-associated core domain-containing protein [Candidatus Kaiserbacteria bacterium]